MGCSLKAITAVVYLCFGATAAVGYAQSKTLTPTITVYKTPT